MNEKIHHMLQVIEAEAKATAFWTGRSLFSDPVMRAMESVPRDQFVPDYYKQYAYENGPLSIGHGQTISQPYIVALMTDLLELTNESRVLEIGTGSGYQTAILCKIAKRVYSVERINALLVFAQQRFATLAYDNIETRCDDGYNGWPEKSPFDAIIVTAAAKHIPESLVQQLKPGGRMVLPVGHDAMQQELVLLLKKQDGSVTMESVLAVSFVPLVSEQQTDNLSPHQAE